MNIVFFGTPNFSAEVLRFLLRNGINIVAVVTKPDKPKGRSGDPVPTPVKSVALEQNPPLPLLQPLIISTTESSELLSSFKPDLFVVVAFGEIIKQHLLDLPRLGCINLHTSLLPKYRGAAPIQRSIMNGETITGLTIMHMVRKMDAGDMIKQVEVPIEPNATFPEIEEALCSAGSQALLEVIRQFETGPVKGTPQNHDLATLAPKIELEDCEINWSLSASILHNLVRGVTPEPGAWCYVNVRWQKKRMKIFRSVVETASGQPGAILAYGKAGLVVACGEHSLRILDVQLEGKKAMSAEELMRGLNLDQLSFQL